MTTTRIRIDISQGIVEAEGTEAFVSRIYADFKDKLQPGGLETKVEGQKKRKQRKAALAAKEEDTTPKKKAKRTNKGIRNPQICRDLDLSGGKGGESLRDFFSKFAPSSNLERNLVFVYYLKQLARIEAITIDHVFTCYRNISSLRTSGNLEQSLIDTRSRKGWIGTASLDDIQLEVAGINYIEHDMKKVKDENA